MQTETTIQKQIATLADGTRISYYTAGAETNPPVILLHGGGTDHAMLSWRDALPALIQAGYRVYAPDYPGYGGSPASGTPATIARLVGYLEQLMEIWDVPQAALIGISLGGSVAIGTALRHPERVSRLVLVGTYGIQDTVTAHALSYLLVKTPGLMNATWAMMRGWRWMARYTLNSLIYNPQSRTEALLEETYEAMRNRDSQLAWTQIQQDEMRWNGLKTNYTPRLSEISVPVLLVHGAKDIGVPLMAARRAAKCFQNARLEVVENAGHWTQRDYPQLFNRLMLDFLAA